MSRGGTGLVQPAKSTATRRDRKVGLGFGGDFDVSVNFGFEEPKTDFSKTKAINVVNNGSSPATFGVAVTNQAGSPPLRGAQRRRRSRSRPAAAPASR